MTNRRRDPARGPRGMQPAGQHSTSSPDAGPSRGRARRSLGRLVVTPTFTAGTCIVFAAVLAYGTTQTHMAFRRLGPPCAGASCPAAGRSHAGVVRPRRAAAPAGTETNGHSRRRAGPARPPAGPDRDANPGAGKPARDMSSVAASPGLPVVIAYRTVRRWHGGFVAMMTITNRSGSAIASWRLFVRYRRARVDRVWGARWHPAAPRVRRAGVVAPRPGRLALRPGASAEFAFRASGHFGPPAGCFFDTARCRFRRARG